MTTSISNAQAELELLRERRRESERALALREQRERETARTTFSRFIILTLCLAVILSTMAFGTVHSWSLAVFQAGAGLVVVLWMADAWRTRRLRLSRNFLQLPLLGFFALGLFQLLPLAGDAAGATAHGLTIEAVRSLSLDPYATRLVLIQFGALIVYFAAALTFIDSPRRLRLVVRTLIIFSFLLALFGLLQYFVSPDKIYGLRESTQSLAFGPFINRHHFAACMAMAAGLPLGLVFAGAIEPDRRLLYVFAAVLMGIALVMTNSRGGMLSLVAEVVFLVFVSGLVRQRQGHTEAGEGERQTSRARGLAVRAAAGAAIVLALLAGVIFFGGEDSLNRLLGTVNSEDPTTGRMHFWRGTVEIIREHPWLGAGLGAFSSAYPPHDTGNGSIYRLEQAHNDYLQILSDGGVVGFALGLLFVVMLFRAGLRRMQSESNFRRGVALGALAGCFAALVHSAVDFPLHTTSNALLFLTLAALATIEGRIESTRKRKQSKRAGGGRRDKTGVTKEHGQGNGDAPVADGAVAAPVA